MWNNNSITITKNQYVNILNLGYAIYEKYDSSKTSDNVFEELQAVMKKYSLPFHYSFNNFIKTGNLEISEEITNLVDFENLVTACCIKKDGCSVNVIFKTKDAFRSLLASKSLVEELMYLNVNLQTNW